MNSWGERGVGGRVQGELRNSLRKAEKAPHLQRTHVPQHHIADPLVVTFDVSVGAAFPEETLK